MSYVEEEKLYTSINDSLTSNPFTQTKKWVKGFSMLGHTDRLEVIKLIHDLQKDAIIIGMENLDETIHIPNLGRFVLNKGRKEFADLLVERPDMDLAEIKEKVVTNYINRFKQRKQKVKWKVAK